MPIEPDCQCQTCINYSKAYIHHLLKAKELLAYTLISIHNVYFMNHLMKSIRHGLATETLKSVKSVWLPQ